jgi:aryl-alcohol dehydrogenase-like predicted oxidoreductase
LLTGKITAATRFAGDDLRNTDPKFRAPRLQQYLSAVAALDRLAHERYGKDVLALAVRWLLDQGRIVALWGARRPDQVTPVSAALGWSLDDATMREIDAILAATIDDPVGPEFMAPPARATKLLATA